MNWSCGDKFKNIKREEANVLNCQEFDVLGTTISSTLKLYHHEAIIQGTDKPWNTDFNEEHNV